MLFSLYLFLGLVALSADWHRPQWGKLLLEGMVFPYTRELVVFKDGLLMAKEVNPSHVQVTMPNPCLIESWVTKNGYCVRNFKIFDL